MLETEPPTSFRCIASAWQVHATELRRFLLHRLGDAALADDLLQELFVKAMAQRSQFCELTNARAWLFHVARNAVADHWRSLGRQQVDVMDMDELPAAAPETTEPVDALTACLDRVLGELAAADAEILRACEFDGLTVKAFADSQGLSLSAAKARLLRARRRLQAHMTQACRIRFDEDGRVVSHAPRPPPGG